MLFMLSYAHNACHADGRFVPNARLPSIHATAQALGRAALTVLRLFMFASWKKKAAKCLICLYQECAVMMWLRRHCANKLDEHSLVGIVRSDRYNVGCMFEWLNERANNERDIFFLYVTLITGKQFLELHFIFLSWLNGIYSCIHNTMKSEFALVNC